MSTSVSPPAESLQLDYSDDESRRFGYRVFRGRAAGIDDREVSATLLEREADIAIIRIPSEQQHHVPRLSGTGFPYIVADTLVYYQVDLANYVPRPLKNATMDFIECRAEHSVTLGAIVKEIFAGYTNHYFSNPLLDRRAFSDAYQEWALRHVAGNGKTAWLVHLDGEPVAFATCAYGGKECEGVLYGVRSTAAGRGIYGDLIRFTQAHFKRLGCGQMTVSTQVQNYAVQTVWNREGFVLWKSLATVHVNSLLSRSVVEKRVLNVEVSTDDIDRCGQYSGDLNPLHFSDSFARDNGFDGRLAHGLIVNSTVSKYYGTEFPGPGTVFLGYSHKFTKPVYPGRSYRLTFSFPFIDSERGFYKSLARLTDEQGVTCLLCYSDLYKRPR